MKLSITSTEKLEKFYLKNLDDKIFNIELDKEQNIPTGWYELIIPYLSKQIEIFDILINNESIKHFLHTGFYQDSNGKIHQPANAVWDNGGYYTIWVHTEIGIMWQRFGEQIKPGDFGTNLFKKYTLTVDKNVIIKDQWSNTLKSFFKNGNGPNWWIKNDIRTPYLVIDDKEILNIDKNHLLTELEKCLPFKHYNLNGHKGWHRIGLRDTCADLPSCEINDLSSKFVRDFIKKLGYKKIIDITIQKLDPNSAVDIHKDDHSDRNYYQHTLGASKFYWNITDPKDIYFKLGTSGLLPLEHPFFVNTITHIHAVINESNKERIVINIKGELKN